MIKVIKKSKGWALGLISSIFSFVPESVFSSIPLKKDNVISKFFSLIIEESDANIIVNKILCFFVILVIMIVIYWSWLKYRNNVTIKDKDFIIKVEYGDLLKTSECKKVISFDECYTTKVGQNPEDVNPDSICGQYIQSHPELDINYLLSKSKLTPERKGSAYSRKEKYKSGSIVTYGEDLLMAFAMLDKDGRGMFPSIKEYIDSLFTMWDEIDKHYGQKDVCVPILGSGITRFEDGRVLSKQELLEIMIWSYRLYSHKIKRPNKLRIICKKDDEFSINKIQGV